MAKSYMEHTRNFWWNFKKYGLRLTSTEIKEAIITIIMIGFVISFREWGYETFNAIIGVQNFIIATVLAAVAFFANLYGQRYIGVYYGYKPEYKMSSIGLMLSLVITFASRGKLIFFLPGYIVIHMLAASRLGEFRYYTNLWEWSKSCFGGPFMNLVLVILLSFTPHKEIAILHKALLINVWFAIFSILPFPFNPGMYMFFYYRHFWAFSAGFIIAACLLALYTNWIIALVGGFLIGGAFIAWYFLKFDEMLGK
jgi:hypothetical protein